jgi:hypothetical protein
MSVPSVNVFGDFERTFGENCFVRKVNASAWHKRCVPTVSLLGYFSRCVRDKCRGIERRRELEFRPGSILAAFEETKSDELEAPTEFRQAGFVAELDLPAR